MKGLGGLLTRSSSRGPYALGAMRVLIIEDQPKMLDLLRRGLQQEGYAVDTTATGNEGVWMGSENPYDAIILDLMLPDMEGREVCRALRHKGQWAPLIILTALDAVSDRVGGLDAGADDFLTKPFSFAELFARLRALLRRGAPERPAVLTVGDLTLDPAAHVVTRRGIPVELTAKEFTLLECFMRHPGQVLSRSRLIDHAWDFAYEGDSNVVDVYVRYLREKIDRPFGAATLQTIRGAGYRLREEPADAAACPG
jgi:two-component system, OmpR family, response regulator